MKNEIKETSNQNSISTSIENNPPNKIEISIENILDLIKTKKNIILTCPKCKKFPPLITEISNQKISYKCLCSSHYISMSLEEFILNIEHLNSSNEKCFKHKEQMATYYCKECKKYLCDICENYHSSFEPDHKVEEQMINNNFQCNYHKNNIKNYYCEDCKIDLCEKCKNVFHKDHLNKINNLKYYYDKCFKTIKFKNIDDVINFYSEKFIEIKNFKNVQTSYLQNLLNQIINIQEDINNECETIIKENYLNMTLYKIIMENFFNKNNNSNEIIPQFITIKNAIDIYESNNNNNNNSKNNNNNINNLKFFSNFSNSFYKNYGFGNSFKTNDTLIQNQIETNLQKFKEISNEFFENHKIIFKMRPSSHCQKKYYFNNKYEKTFIVKKNNLNLIHFNPDLKIKVNSIIELINGNIAIACNDKTIKIISSENFELIDNLIGHSSQVSVLYQLKNGLLLSGAGNNYDSNSFKVYYSESNNSINDSIRLWNLDKKECLKIINIIPNPINAICELKNGNIAVTNMNINSVLILDNINFNIINSINTEFLMSNVLFTLKKSGFLVVNNLFNFRGGKNYIKIFDTENNNLVHLIDVGYDKISNIYEIEDNKLIYLKNKNLVIYNLNNNQEEINISLDNTNAYNNNNNNINNNIWGNANNFINTLNGNNNNNISNGLNTNNNITNNDNNNTNNNNNIHNNNNINNKFINNNLNNNNNNNIGFNNIRYANNFTYIYMYPYNNQKILIANNQNISIFNFIKNQNETNFEIKGFNSNDKILKLKNGKFIIITNFSSIHFHILD